MKNKYTTVRFWKAKVLLSLAMSFLFSQADASLSGKYTIDASSSASSSNYKDFKSAVSDLISGTRSDGGTANGSGVKGRVIFSVANGSYNEQIAITAISGVSAINTVTFQSASGDSSLVRLWNASATTLANNYTLQLDGASYVNFKKITIQRSGTSTYGRVIEFKSGSKHDTFSNNRIMGIKNGTGGTNQVDIYSAADADSANYFGYNSIKYGYYGFYWYGATTAIREAGTVITGNILDSVYYYGMRLQYQDGLVITNNRLTNFINTTNYGIYVATSYNRSEISGNLVNIKSNGYGLYLPSLTGTSDTAIVANNMVTLGNSTSSGYGIYCGTSFRTKIFHNSVLINGTLATSAAMYLGASGNSYYVHNNNLVNRAGGYAIFHSSSTVTMTEDNNNFYTTGTNIGSYNGILVSKIATWQALSGRDASSFSFNPTFTSNTDLHTATAILNDKGLPVNIMTDIDGKARSASTPDVGATEFTPAGTDAGISAIDSPGGNICVGKHDVYVRFFNNGGTALTSVNLNWSVNGTLQTGLAWTGSIASGSFSPSILLGTYTYATSTTYNFKVWTSSPNATTDGDNSNDTLQKLKLSSGLSGTYTIGGTSPDYNTFTLAVADLRLRGVCGPVTFNVRDGSYKEQIMLDSISGASSINKITFQSQNGDSSKVILNWAATTSTANNYVVYLKGTNNIILKQMSIIRTAATATSYYGNVILIDGNTHDVQLLNNRLIGVHVPTTSPGSYSNANVVYSSKDYDYNITISNNFIRNGYYGIYLYGITTGYEKGNIVSGNKLDSAYTYGIVMYYQDNARIQRNEVKDLTVANSAIGIYAYRWINSGIISDNKVSLNNGGYGMYNYYLLGSSTDSVFIYNNFISVDGNGTTGYGIYSYYGDYSSYLHNNINVPGTFSTRSYALYLYATTGHASLYNNNFINPGGGAALYVNTTALTVSDYNNFFTTGAILALYNATTCAKLSNWQTASSQDANSISFDPAYYSKTDLHVKSITLNGTGTPMAYVRTDIDGDKRSMTSADIGADEFTPPPYDAGTFSIDSPGSNFCAGKHTIYATIKNNGSATLTSAKVSWSINGGTPTVYNWTGSLASSAASTSILLGSYTFSAASSYDLKVWTSLPNGNTDADPSNDTIIKLKLKNGMSGTYTIGGSSPDYATFGGAVTDLKARGVCGPVTFNVRNGSYNEQIQLDSIAGAGPSSRVIFQSQAGDSSKVILYWSATTTNTNNYVIWFNKASYITLKKISVQRLAVTTGYYGNVIVMDGTSHDNYLLNNRLIGVHVPTTSPGSYTNANVVVSSKDCDSNNMIINNVILNGYYGINYMGMTARYEAGTVISGNIVDSAYYYGMVVYYQNAPVVSGNSVSALTVTNGYGIYLYSLSNKSIISKNRVSLMNGGYGMMLYYILGTSSDSAYIFNNFITIDGVSSTGIGMYNFYGDYNNIVHNSVNITGTFNATASYALYLYSTNRRASVYNNNWVNKGLGRAMYISNSALIASDNNNIYTKGATLTSYNGVLSGNLGAWQTLTSQDANSKSADPGYYSKTNLHAKSTFINNAGIPFADIKDDMDGDKRSTSTPDIGADEFSPLGLDAAVTNIDSPYYGYCGSKSSVIVQLVNMGSTTLTSVKLNWSVNGTPQTAVNWTGSLAAAAGTPVKLGTYSFSSPTVYSIKVYLSAPNGGTDLDPSNDTIVKTNIAHSMSGTYTIGGASPDYSTFSLAAKDLRTRGVCGPVTFNVANGTYTEKVFLDSVSGVSKVNTILFQSASGDSSKVVLTAPSQTGTVANYVLHLRGTDWCTFKKMTFQRTGTAIYNRLIEIDSEACNNVFTNNRMIGLKTGTNLIESALISSSVTDDTSNLIQNNYMQYGYCGIYWFGSSGKPAGFYEGGTIIRNNIFDSVINSGMYVYYQQNPKITGNIINLCKVTGAPTTYGIRAYYCNGRAWVLKNKITMYIGGYGIYNYYMQGDTTGNALVANNFISVPGTAASFGIYNYYGNLLDIAYNSINITNTNTTSSAIWLYNLGGGLLNLTNNNFVNVGGGYAFYNSSASISDYSDYNNLYTTGSYVGYVSATKQATLTDWIAAGASNYGMDSNSVSVDPKYSTSIDLHASSSFLDGKGVILPFVKDDIDGQARSSTKPDIGADEFALFTLDAGIVSLDTPVVNFCVGSNRVVATLANLGANTLTSVKIN